MMELKVSSSDMMDMTTSQAEMMEMRVVSSNLQQHILTCLYGDQGTSDTIIVSTPPSSSLGATTAGQCAPTGAPSDGHRANTYHCHAAILAASSNLMHQVLSEAQVSILYKLSDVIIFLD